MKNRGVMTPSLSASFNAKKILKYNFDYEIDAPLVHTYVPLRKSMFKEVWYNYNDEISSFLSNKLVLIKSKNLGKTSFI